MISMGRFEKFADDIRGIVNSWAFTVLVLPMVLVWKLLINNPADPDIFARVAMGRLVLRDGAVPTRDPFAFTQKSSTWIDHEWLSGVIFYLTTAVAGDFGLTLLKLVLAVGSALCILYASRAYVSTIPGRFLWVLLCVMQATGVWITTTRCQSFTYLFIPLVYLAIVHYRAYGRIFPLAVTPLLGLVWVNLHGGYALGCCILACLGLAQLWERKVDYRLILIGLAWATAPVFTPYGFATFTEKLIEGVLMARPGVMEWYPLTYYPEKLLTTALLSVPVVFGFWKTRHARDPLAVILIVFSAYCAGTHYRFLPLYLFTIAIFGGFYVRNALLYLTGVLGQRVETVARAWAMAMVMVGGLFVVQALVLACNPKSYRLDYATYPMRAIDWLRITDQRGRLLVGFNNGSLALWRLYPNFTASLDGRYEEVYPQQTVDDVAIALNPWAPQHGELLKKLVPTHILVTKDRKRLVRAADFGPSWKVGYEDAAAMVLIGSSVNTPEAPEYVFDHKQMWMPAF
jgi:hypothetical protein